MVGIRASIGAPKSTQTSLEKLGNLWRGVGGAFEWETRETNQKERKIWKYNGEIIGNKSENTSWYRRELLEF